MRRTTGRPLARFVALSFAAVLACGRGADGGEDGGRDGGGEAPTPIEIVTFEATPSTANPRDSIELHWVVREARVVDVILGRETLVSTFGAEGRLRTPALTETSTFTLAARAGDQVVEAELVVPVEWPPPQISSFAVDQSVASAFGSVTLSWVVADTRTIAIDRNGTELRRVPAENSFLLVQVEERDTVFTLRAINPAGVATRSLDVRVVPLPRITEFRVTPQLLFRRGPVTILWATQDATFVELSSNNAASVPGFPRTLSGTMTLEVSTLPETFTLSAFNEVSVSGAFIGVGPPSEEFEPNGSPSNASPMFMPPAARGRLATVRDVDVYVTNLEPGRPMRAFVAGPDGTGCAVDTSLVLSSFDRELARDSNDGAPTGRGGACAEIHAGRDPEAVTPPDFAPILFTVGSEAGEVGDYVLVVELL